MATEVQESYEELRRKKLEENKRKLDELKLHYISSSLREASASPKPSPVKRVKRQALEPSPIKRRSDRIANLPEPAYKEVIPDVVPRPRKMISKHRDLSGRVYASDEARAYTIEKAEQLEAELGNEHPSFIKPMLQSHTTGGFWLGLPNQFCSKHLPKNDSTIILIDEDGSKSDTTYLARKKGLSAGWRGFSINHDLVDGDALVFQLINSSTFKVYIFRAREYDSS
ncbi:uncharacterized protein A4U43_C05F860 [Asparagus officinalis]|uniref:TF-B3 domain-containing protein n=1 Tax=Asparagus officinalis TaxID=4686 RepID=A0A5P1EQW5_ASPOF|nr:B3 domain-containing protein Os06g0194400-like isoform X2 [Asparagus officinalis]ONK67517.1 uncharacterized protein A4U43_C05F860 [Asparagus officinalis]